MKHILQMIICISLTAFFSCFDVTEKSSSRLPTMATEENSVVSHDTLFFENDSIVIAQPVKEGKAAVLKWGVVGKEFNTGKDTLPYSPLGFSRTYKVSDYFVVEDGCGTGCKYLYFVSFRSNREGLFLSPLIFDLDKEVIVYQGESMNELVTVQNIASGKKLKVEKEFDKTKRPYSLAIDTVFIARNKLILTWYSPTQKKMTKEIDLESVL